MREYWFRQEHGQDLPGSEVREKIPEPRPLRCRTCGQPVTDDGLRIAVGGQHVHNLFNPMGILFEVGCFAKAPGCRFDGVWTKEFTWFPGHAWRYALCGGCGAHLGWEYRGEGSGFVGLIVTELTGGDSSG